MKEPETWEKCKSSLEVIFSSPLLFDFGLFKFHKVLANDWNSARTSLQSCLTG